MGLPDNGRGKGPARYLMPSSKTSSARNGLPLVESLAKGVLWTPTQTSQVISKAISCPLQSDAKALLLKTSLLFKHRKVKLVPNWKLHHY